MLTSMTGFGRATGAMAPSGRVEVEIRAVNHRFLEVEVRLPEGLQALEGSVRAVVARQARRGQVRVSIAVKQASVQPKVVFQTAVARYYLHQIRQFQRQMKADGPVKLETLFGLPQVFSIEKRELSAGRQWPSVERTLRRALAEMVQMRRREGGRLQEELRRLARLLKQSTDRIQRRVPEFQKRASDRLAERIKMAVKKASPALAENHRAILAEAVSMVQASDISEELARLGSHLEALNRAVSGVAPAGGETTFSPGRTIDFLAQEFQREVNTLGSKLRDNAVLQDVVAMKGQIEKLREQAANIE